MCPGTACDVSEPCIGSSLDVCFPAAPDAACRVTFASTLQTGTWGDTAAGQGKLPSDETPAAAASQGAKARRC